MIRSSAPRLLTALAPVLVLGLLAVPARALAAQAPTPAASPARQGSEPAPVFRIDDELVPVDRYGAWISRVMGPLEAYSFALIHRVEREAERLGVEVTEAEVEAQVEEEIRVRVENAFRGSVEEWEAELVRIGRSPGEYRRARSVELRPWLLATKLADIDRVVPERKVVREWELAYGAGGRRYELCMLLLLVVQEMPPEGTPVDVRKLEREQRKRARLAEARALRERVLAGEDLGELARRLSDDPATRANGGRPPDGFSHFGWPTAFVEALAALEPGDLSEPLYAKGGWWLVEVLEVDETPLAEVRDELVAELAARGPESDEVAVVQQRLMQGVEVEVLPALFETRPEGEFPDAFEPVLRVGDDVVRRGEYALWLMHTHGAAYASRYIENTLVERKARALGVVVTDADVRERVREHVEERIANAYRGSREAFKTYLDVSGLTEERYAKRFAWRARSDLLVERLIQLERTVTPEELRQAWVDAYGRDGIGQEVRSLAVPIELPPLDPGLDQEGFAAVVSAAAEAARTRAARVVERIENGEDFAGVAGRVGGAPVDVVDAAPHRFQPETWPEEIAGPVSALAPGEVSAPLRYGPLWLVFECLARRQVAFEDVRDELEATLLAARPASVQIAAYRNTLIKAADVEVLPALYE